MLVCVCSAGMLGVRQRSTESHPGQSECGGMGGWVDNVIRAERKRERRGINVIKTVVSINTLRPGFKKQTQHSVTGNHPCSLQKTEAESGCEAERTQAGSFPSV